MGQIKVTYCKKVTKSTMRAELKMIRYFQKGIVKVDDAIPNELKMGHCFVIRYFILNHLKKN